MNTLVSRYRSSALSVESLRSGGIVIYRFVDLGRWDLITGRE